MPGPATLRTITDNTMDDLIDIGANLTHDSFDADRDTVIANARAAGVAQMVVTGADEPGSLAAVELASGYPGVVFPTAGVHPHRAMDFSAATESVFRELYAKRRVVAVGETGLDYFRDFSPRPAQRSAFERHLALAADSGLPMFLHQRDAHDDFVAMLGEWRSRLGAVVVHCFTGGESELAHYRELDCHIGITGWLCDERRGAQVQAVVGKIPGDRLMAETDAPYLKPRDLQPRVKTHRNEPQWLPWIVQRLADCRGEPVAQTAAATTATARAFFDLPRPPD